MLYKQLKKLKFFTLVKKAFKYFKFYQSYTFSKKRKYMSTYTDEFERELANIICTFSGANLPLNLPDWVKNLGITTNNTIKHVARIGSAGHKTDLAIYFDNGAILKVSAKMSSADYFGNWYSHGRVIEEFGEDIFQKLTIDCTNWANNWINNSNASLFVGVSICFGKRTGNTSSEFTEVFTLNDIIKIVAGTGTGIETANCLYSSSYLPSSLQELFEILKPIDSATIKQLSKNFKLIYRPINPLTEGTNRGKCTYTQFIPNYPFQIQTRVDNLCDLKSLGTFQTVSANSLNHNRILNELRDKYNIFIPRKS